MSKMGAKLVSGHRCKYANICNIRNSASGYSSWHINTENCIIYKLMEDVQELKKK